MPKSKKITNRANTFELDLQDTAKSIEVPVVALESKPFWTSATFWLNALVLAPVLLGELTDLNLVAYYVQEPDTADRINRGLLGAIALANLFLRLFKTKQPVSLT